MVSANDYLIKDFEGIQPASDSISKKMLKEILTGTVQDYFQFIQRRLASDAVEEARRIASEYKIGKEIGEKPFFVSDEDLGINGSVGNSFALVKPGKKDAPLRIIISHSDVPSLRIPVNPMYAERDSEKELACPAIALRTEPSGGIRPEDWYGMEVDIIGKIYLNGKEKRIELPGRIKAKSLHVDDPQMIKNLEGLKVDTGIRTTESFYRALGIKSADDFARAKLYCLPHIEGRNGRLVGNELGAFGHDDRSCLWASLKAGLESLVHNDNTTIIYSLDNEEIGSIGTSAHYRGFFENVLIETLKIVQGTNSSKITLPADLNRSLLGNMPALFADVSVGIGPEELVDPINVSHDEASRLGWGVIISQGITTSPKHVSNMIDILEKKLPGRVRGLRYQIGGDYTPADMRYGFESAQMSHAFADVMPCLNMGIPVSGLHHPRTEVINVFDLHWMKEAYKLYLKE